MIIKTNDGWIEVESKSKIPVVKPIERKVFDDDSELNAELDRRKKGSDNEV
jgi:hypothetical protein